MFCKNEEKSLKRGILETKARRKNMLGQGSPNVLKQGPDNEKITSSRAR